MFLAFFFVLMWHGMIWHVQKLKFFFVDMLGWISCCTCLHCFLSWFLFSTDLAHWSVLYWVSVSAQIEREWWREANENTCDVVLSHSRFWLWSSCYFILFIFLTLFHTCSSRWDRTTRNFGIASVAAFVISFVVLLVLALSAPYSMHGQWEKKTRKKVKIMIAITFIDVAASVTSVWYDISCS